MVMWTVVVAAVLVLSIATVSCFVCKRRNKRQQSSAGYPGAMMPAGPFWYPGMGPPWGPRFAMYRPNFKPGRSTSLQLKPSLSATGYGPQQLVFRSPRGSVTAGNSEISEISRSTAGGTIGADYSDVVDMESEMESQLDDKSFAKEASVDTTST